MPDPTPEPTPAPTPATLPSVQPFDKVAVGVGGGEFIATPVVNIAERGDRAEATESRKAGAMDRMAGAVESANAQLLAALAQPVPVAERSERDVYLETLWKCAALPFMYDEKYGRLDTNRADDTARDIVRLWKTYGA